MASPVRTTLSFLALLGALSMAFGCAAAPPQAQTPEGSQGPAWIDRPNGTYDDGGAVVLYAVGVAARNPNPAARRTMAMSRGRTELARTLSTAVQAMVEDYQSTSRDFFEGDDTASSVEMFTDVARQVTDEVLVGSQLVEAWRNPVDNTEYVLMKLEFDSVIGAYHEKMQESIRREATRKRIKVKSDAALGRLEDQITKLHAAPAEEINDEFISN